jgi:hypothetical protein
MKKAFLSVLFAFTLLSSAGLSAAGFKIFEKNLIAKNIPTVTPEEVERLRRESQDQRVPKYYYGYPDREHTLKENIGHIAAVYGISWAIYPLTQPKVFSEEGSFKRYRRNFGQLVFDKDEPFWNQMVHPISGSQLFLYYRANGYARMDSFLMTFISSALFETTVEVYTEPASVQDLYITPVYGSILALGLENLSMYLLNTGNAFGRFLGHVINPATLFWFYDGKVQIVPNTDLKEKAALSLSVSF